jgi:hypothetical protein
MWMIGSVRSCSAFISIYVSVSKTDHYLKILMAYVVVLRASFTPVGEKQSVLGAVLVG